MSLHVLISGAGIAGLVTAISLRRAGHRVTLFERSAMNNEVGAAVTVPPNVARFLLPLGFDTARARFRAFPSMHIMSHATMEPVMMIQDGAVVRDMYGAPLFGTHRVDLHEELKRMATDPTGPGIPAEIQLRAKVVAYDSAAPSITLIDGTIVKGDMVIAADGVHSLGAEAVTGTPNRPMPARHDNTCYRFLIPVSTLKADPETRPFLDGPYVDSARLFIDKNDRSRRLVTYLVRDKEVGNFAVICEDGKINPDKAEDWHASATVDDVLRALHGCHPVLSAIIRKATDVKRWPLLFRAPIPTWHKDKLVLIGDAAHPMLPHHAQGAAQAMEDGVSLGLLLHGITDAAQIPERLALFHELRYNRASAIQVLSNYGFEEKIDENLVRYMPAEKALPTTASEMVDFAYGHDVVQETIRIMQAVDPAWALPEGFFPGPVEPEFQYVTYRKP